MPSLIKEFARGNAGDDIAHRRKTPGDMQLSGKRILLVLATLAVTAGSANVPTTSSPVRKQQMQLESFDDLLQSIDNLSNTPLIGKAIAPYVKLAEGLIVRLDDRFNGSIANIVDGMTPCRLNGIMPVCEGQLDMNSVRSIARQMLNSLSLDSMPQSVSSIIVFARNMI